MKFENILTAKISMEDIFDRFRVENRCDIHKNMWHVAWDRKRHCYVMEEEINLVCKKIDRKSKAYYKFMFVEEGLKELRDYIKNEKGGE